MQSRQSGRTFVIALALAGAVILGMQFDPVGRISYAIEKGQLQANSEALAGVQQLSQVFRMVGKTVKPAVVKVINSSDPPPGEQKESKEEPSEDREPSGRPEDMQDFLRKFFEGGPRDVPFEFRQRPDRPRRGPRTEGIGSGVIIDAEKGYVLTNYHVIQGAASLKVDLSDGRRVRSEHVKVVGTDKLTDLAVIQIETDRLHDVPFGDSSTAEVGDYVLAVGNPFGLEGSLSAGIISAKGRSRMGLTGYEDFIQTDASINPGNSGGPLVNIRGQIIGINTAIPTRNGVYNGFGFAIPGNLAKRVSDRLINEGKVVRGYLGVGIRSLHPGEGVKVYLLDGDDGVLIEAVYRDTPATKADLASGDVILTMDGVPIKTAEDLQNRVAFTRPGSTVKLEILRSGERQTVDVEIGEQPEGFFPRHSSGKPRPEELDRPESAAVTNEKLGITVETASSRSARRYNLDDQDEGAVITQVKPGSEAESLGLRPGDLVTAVVIEGKRQAILSAEDFAERVTPETLGNGLNLIVRTRDGSRHLFLQFD